MFDQFNNSGTIDVKLDGSVSEKKSTFKMLELTFSSKFRCRGMDEFQRLHHSNTKFWTKTSSLSAMICYLITVFLFLRKKLYKSFHRMDQSLCYLQWFKSLKFCKKRAILSNVRIKLLISPKVTMSLTLF